MTVFSTKINGDHTARYRPAATYFIVRHTLYYYYSSVSVKLWSTAGGLNTL